MIKFEYNAIFILFSSGNKNEKFFNKLNLECYSENSQNHYVADLEPKWKRVCISRGEVWNVVRFICLDLKLCGEKYWKPSNTMVN